MQRDKFAVGVEGEGGRHAYDEHHKVADEIRAMGRQDYWRDKDGNTQWMGTLMREMGEKGLLPRTS